MSEIATALSGAGYDGLVKVAEAPVQGMITLRGDLSSATLAKAVKEACGADLPAVRTMRPGKQGACLWMSPDEILILCDYANAPDVADALSQALAGTHHLCAVVSDARAMFTLTGHAVREVLGKLAPVDLSSDQFQPGQVRRTRMAQVAAAFWLTDDQTAQIVCFRSVGQYMLDLLCTVAQPDSAVGFYTKD